MNFKGQLGMESCPDFSVQAKTEPIAFATKAKGSFVAQVSSISVQVSEIPINLSIPFLRRAGGIHTVASIGSFGIKLSPFTVAVEGANVQLAGVLGTKGITTQLEGKVGCKSKLSFNGKLFGKIANCSVDLPDDDFEEHVDTM
ncbi:MAG TPA: hypothetical protein PKM72_02210 [Nitrospirales bacterium]|nr:hypothetical protein [Nitrospirales bacterium]